MKGLNQLNSRRVLLLGLPDPSLARLGAVLSGRHDVRTSPFLSLPAVLGMIRDLDADVVCCAADRGLYPALLEAVKQTGSAIPVVVVSSSADVSEWLDAIDAGAWDYVADPFESGHIEHVIENAIRCAGAVS